MKKALTPVEAAREIVSRAHDHGGLQPAGTVFTVHAPSDQFPMPAAHSKDHARLIASVRELAPAKGLHYVESVDSAFHFKVPASESAFALT